MITAEQLLIKAAELKKKKSEDYQGSTWKEVDYFPIKKNLMLTCCILNI